MTFRQSKEDVANLYELRKSVESDILSTHGDASNFFVTFLDNHDQTSRYYYRNTTNPDTFDDQVTLGVGCLFALPGIPCLARRAYVQSKTIKAEGRESKGCLTLVILWRRF